MRSARILSAVRGHLARHLRAESVKENSQGSSAPREPSPSAFAVQDTSLAL